MYIACSIWNSIRVYMGIVTVYTFFFWCSLRKFLSVFLLVVTWEQILYTDVSSHVHTRTDFLSCSHWNSYCIYIHVHVSAGVHSVTVSLYVSSGVLWNSICINRFHFVFSEKLLYIHVSSCVTCEPLLYIQ